MKSHLLRKGTKICCLCDEDFTHVSDNRIETRPGTPHFILEYVGEKYTWPPPRENGQPEFMCYDFESLKNGFESYI